MTTPASSPNEPSKFKQILDANNMDESVTSRLPRANRVRPTEGGAPIIIAPVPPEYGYTEPRYKFLPAFWTIASTISILVNVGLIAVVFILLQMLGSIQAVSNDKVTGLLAELYGSFAAMDSATISRVVPVDASIPLNLTVPVNLTDKQIVLTRETRITGVRVEIHEGGVNIDTPRAVITLPQGTPLMINLERVDLAVQNTVPIHIDVPVNIPLNETELHAPFVGLRNIVQPYYCMVQPQALYAGVQVCAP